jgi:hypothetical protein
MPTAAEKDATCAALICWMMPASMPLKPREIAAITACGSLMSTPSRNCAMNGFVCCASAVVCVKPSPVFGPEELVPLLERREGAGRELLRRLRGGLRRGGRLLLRVPLGLQGLDVAGGRERGGVGAVRLELRQLAAVRDLAAVRLGGLRLPLGQQLPVVEVLLGRLAELRRAGRVRRRGGRRRRRFVGRRLRRRLVRLTPAGRRSTSACAWRSASACAASDAVRWSSSACTCLSRSISSCGAPAFWSFAISSDSAIRRRRAVVSCPTPPSRGG